MSERYTLIIEDDEDLATIFAQAFQEVGFQIEIIIDGAKAQDRLHQDPAPNLVVLDLHLPHVSGRKLLQQMRADERLAHTQVIIATADPRLAEQLEDQADLILLKPISFKQLRALAQRLRPQ